MALWTPAEITGYLWLCPDDASTVTLNGTSVAQINDKFGGANYAAQATASYQPALTSYGLNGKSILTFSTDKLTLATAIDFRNKLVCIVIRHTTAALGQIWSHSSINNQFRFDAAATGMFVAGGTPIWTNTIAATSVITFGAWSVIILDGAAASGKLYINGTLLDTGGAQSVAANFNQLGVRSTSNEPLIGDIAEALVVPNTEDRQMIEGYLHWRFGLESLLPSDHPYKATAPGITTIRIMAVLEQMWGDPPFVSAGLSQLWGIKMGADLHQAWTDAPVIRTILSQPWGNASVLRAELLQRWESTFTLRATLEQGWNIFGVVQAELAQRWSITADLVRGVLDQGWDLRARDLLRAELLQRWAIEADGAVLRYQVAVAVDGVAVGIKHLNIEGGLDQDVLSCELHLGTEGDYLRCGIGVDVMVAITSASGFESFAFVITAPRITEAHGNTQYIVEAMSPAVLLGEPYATPITGELTGLASVIAATLSGSIPLSWQTVDWEIPPSTWIASGETPLALLKTLAAAVGAVVQSLPDGSLVVTPEYRDSVNQWATGTPDLSLVENMDCWTTGSAPELKSGYNRFVIGDQLTTANTLRLDEESVSDTVKIVRGYQTPWTGVFELAHTGGEWVVIEPLGIEERQETETVEIIAGAGRVQYPIYSRDLVEWGQINLGSITFAEDGSVQSAVEGESLLTLTYTTRCRKWQVRDPRNEQLQLVVPA